MTAARQVDLYFCFMASKSKRSISGRGQVPLFTSVGFWPGSAIDAEIGCTKKASQFAFELMRHPMLQFKVASFIGIEVTASCQKNPDPKLQPTSSRNSISHRCEANAKPFWLSEIAQVHRAIRNSRDRWDAGHR